MIKHQVVIAKKNDIADMDELKSHPNVLKLIEIPYDYVLFELYNELIHIQYDPDPKIRYQIATDYKMNRKMRKFVAEKEKLLKPLFSQEIQGLKPLYGLIFHINEVSYIYQCAKRYKFVNLFETSKIINTTKLEIEVEFRSLLKSKMKAYEKAMDEWTAWGKNAGNIESTNSIDFFETSEDYIGKNTVIFSKNIEDSLAAFIMIIHETKGKTGIKAIRY